MVKSPLARMAIVSSVAYTVASRSGAAIAGLRVYSCEWRVARRGTRIHYPLTTDHYSQGSVHLYWGSPIGVIVYPAVAEGQLAQTRVQASVQSWRQATQGCRIKLVMHGSLGKH